MAVQDVMLVAVHVAMVRRPAVQDLGAVQVVQRRCTATSITSGAGGCSGCRHTSDLYVNLLPNKLTILYCQVVTTRVTGTRLKIFFYCFNRIFVCIQYLLVFLSEIEFIQ